MITIIIPAFNNSNKVERILKRVTPDKGLELILVDDGSSFTESNRLKHFSEIYAARYIYQYNQGPSKARWNGLKHAKNDYVLFLDADDIFDFENLDFTIFDRKYDYFTFISKYCNNVENEKVLDYKVDFKYRTAGKFIFFISQFGYKTGWNSSNTIYKKSSIDKIFQPNTLKWAEDLLLKYKVFSKLNGLVQTQHTRSFIEISNGRGYLYSYSDVLNLYKELNNSSSGRLVSLAVLLRYTLSCFIKKIKSLLTK